MSIALGNIRFQTLEHLVAAACVFSPLQLVFRRGFQTADEVAPERRGAVMAKEERSVEAYQQEEPR